MPRVGEVSGFQQGFEGFAGEGFEGGRVRGAQGGGFVEAEFAGGDGGVEFEQVAGGLEVEPEGAEGGPGGGGGRGVELDPAAQSASDGGGGLMEGQAFGTVDAGAMALAGVDDAPGASTAAQEAISALVNLGYGRPQAATAIAASLKALGDSAETAALIRRGLKELATI